MIQKGVNLLSVAGAALYQSPIHCYTEINMNHPNKHITSVLLMTTSIVLLVAFQAFWLKKVYEEQRTWLQKEADNLFRATIMSLQDSIIQSKFLVDSDSCDAPMLRTPEPVALHQGSTSTIIFRSDSTLPADIPPVPDSFFKHKAKTEITLAAKDSASFWKSRENSGRLRMASRLSSLPADSIRSIHINKTLNQVILNVQKIDGERNFVIRINEDTLATAAVQKAFVDNLKIAGLPDAFTLQKTTLRDHADTTKDRLMLGPIPAGMPPREMFLAELQHYEGYLFRKIIPQGLFSLFLVGITTLAFWFIYRSLRKQQRLAQLKNDFISNVTHELKTPIATVSVAIEAMNNFNALDNPQLTREYLDISKNELNRLNLLVDKVLKMAIFEQGEPDLRMEQFDLREMIQQIVTSMKLQFEKFNAKVSFQTNGEHFHMQADRIHLTNVVYNLIDNALKYSRENPVINLNLIGQNGHIHLEVEDNGIGIAPEHQRRIFEKFYRVTSGDVHNTKGHGLGLSYVANVIQKHGGTIELKSEPGVGSSFTVHLPRDNDYV